MFMLLPISRIDSTNTIRPADRAAVAGRARRSAGVGDELAWRSSRGGRSHGMAAPVITGRGLQIALGVVWLVAGLLQFQAYMYTHAFVAQVLEPAAAGQPSAIGDPIVTLAGFYGRDLVLWNTLAAELQCAIGLGLIVTRRAVRPALAVSFVWSALVWWIGEGFGRLTANVEPSPLVGAPGAVIIYALIGAALWPAPAPAATGIGGPWRRRRRSATGSPPSRGGSSGSCRGSSGA